PSSLYPDPPQQVFYTPSGGTPIALDQVGWSSRALGWIYVEDPPSSGTWRKQINEGRPVVKSTMTPGSFFCLDSGGSQSLYIRLPGDAQPQVNEIEVSTRFLFNVGVPGVHAKGFVFEHSNTAATTAGYPPVSGGEYSVFESCVIR